MVTMLVFALLTLLYPTLQKYSEQAGNKIRENLEMNKENDSQL